MSVKGNESVGGNKEGHGLREEEGENSGGGRAEDVMSQHSDGSGNGGNDVREPLDLPEDILEAVRDLSIEELRQRILRRPGPDRSSSSSPERGPPETPARPPPNKSADDTECQFKQQSIPFREVMELLREERAIWDKLAKKQSSERQPRRHVMPPKPAMYDGLSHGEVFLQDYISFVEDSSYDDPVNEDFVMSFPAFLTGRARAWYKRLPNEDKRDWSLLRDLFKERFIAQFQNIARNSYKRRMQGEHETVAQYSLDMDQLMSSACVPPDEMLSVYVANLRECLSEQVLRYTPKDVREAEKVATEIEASFLASALYVKPLMKPVKSSPSLSDSKLIQKVVDRLQSLDPCPEDSSEASSPEETEAAREEAIISKILERLRPSNKKSSPQHTIAALTPVEEAGVGKKSKSKKKKGQASPQLQQNTGTASKPTNPHFPMFQPMPYPFFPGQVMQPFPGQGQFTFPPPLPPAAQQTMQQPPRAPQNQGN